MRKTSTILDLFAVVPRMGYSVILEEGIMEKAETIRARVEAKLKADAEAVLDKLGLTASDAIRLFYKQVALRRGLPFDVVIPNAATRKAMRDVIEGRELTKYKDTREMFEKLGANRQLIVELFPTPHRRASRFSNRQDIVEIRGGGKCCSRHLGAGLLLFVRCLRPRVGASDYKGNLTNCREKPALRCPIIGLWCHSLATSPTGNAGRNRHKLTSIVSAPADIQGGDEVAEETLSGLNDELSVRNRGS